VSLLLRLKPYIWPNRHRVLLSFFFAALVAVLWGANLSIAIPVVKVLIERESLPAFVTSQMENAQAEIAGHRDELDRLAVQAEAPLSAKESLKIVSRQARFERPASGRFVVSGDAHRPSIADLFGALLP